MIGAQKSATTFAIRQGAQRVNEAATLLLGNSPIAESKEIEKLERSSNEAATLILENSPKVAQNTRTTNESATLLLSPITEDKEKVGKKRERSSKEEDVYAKEKVKKKKSFRKFKSIVKSADVTETSILSQVFHSNMQAFGTIFFASILITGSMQTLSHLVAKKYDYSFCACVSMMGFGELFLMMHNKFEKKYVLRHVFLQDPIHFLLYWGICVLFFPNPEIEGSVQPGRWSLPIMLISWFPAMASTYFVNKRGSFKKHVQTALILSVVMGLSIWTLTYGYMLPTELASNSSALATALVTGILLPFAIFACKKLLMYCLWFRINKKSEHGENYDVNIVAHFSLGLYASSLLVTVVPVTLLYYNFDLRYVILCLLCQKCIEVGGRDFTMIMITHDLFAKFMARIRRPKNKIAPELEQTNDEPDSSTISQPIKPTDEPDILNVSQPPINPTDKLDIFVNQPINPTDKPASLPVSQPETPVSLLRPEAKPEAKSDLAEAKTDALQDSLQKEYDSSQGESLFSTGGHSSSESAHQVEETIDAINISTLDNLKNYDRLRIGATMIMVAVRWQQEFTAQKVALFVGPIMLYNISPTEKILDHLLETMPLCVGIEFFSNIVIVWVVVKFFDLPLLTHVPREKLMSGEFIHKSIYSAILITTVAMAFAVAEQQMQLLVLAANE